MDSLSYRWARLSPIEHITLPPNFCAFFKEGEVPIGLYLRRSGKASLIMTAEDGEEVLHLTVCPGLILGVPAVVGRDHYTLSAFAGPGAEVGFVAREDFEEVIRSEPSLFPKVLEVLAAEVSSARIALSGLLSKLSKQQA